VVSEPTNFLFADHRQEEDCEEIQSDTIRVVSEWDLTSVGDRGRECQALLTDRRRIRHSVEAL